MMRLQDLRDALAIKGAPRLAVAAALVLLAIGLFMALLNERGYRAHKADEITIQAQIVAASVVPALLFQDPDTAQEYIEALAANPDLQAAAIYDADGARFAALALSEAAACPFRASTRQFSASPTISTSSMNSFKPQSSGQRRSWTRANADRQCARYICCPGVGPWRTRQRECGLLGGLGNLQDGPDCARATFVCDPPTRSTAYWS